MTMWDGVHAGLEAATLYRASQAQQALAEMQATAQNESARRALVEEMKNSIFTLARAIQVSEEKYREQPQQLFILSMAFLHELAESGLSPQSFPDIQDKEYFAKTFDNITRVGEETKQRLTEEESEEALTALKFAVEMPKLRVVIAAKTAQESLAETEKEWSKVSSYESRRNLLKVSGIIGIVCTFVMGCPLSCVALAGFSGKGATSQMLGMVFLLIAAAFPTASIAAFIFASKSNRVFASLKAKRDGWRAQLLSKDDWREAIELFGNLSTEDYRNLCAKRLAFLAPIIGTGVAAILPIGEED